MFGCSPEGTPPGTSVRVEKPVRVLSCYSVIVARHLNLNPNFNLNRFLFVVSCFYLHLSIFSFRRSFLTTNNEPQTTNIFLFPPFSTLPFSFSVQTTSIKITTKSKIKKQHNHIPYTLIPIFSRAHHPTASGRYAAHRETAPASTRARRWSYREV